jgi:hypothetical protein
VTEAEAVPPRLVVRLPAGRLSVRGGVVPSVQVLAVRPKFAADARAVAAAEQASVDASTAAVQVQVPDPPGRGRTPQVLVEVAVPAGTAVVADCPEAEVVCTGPVGALRVFTSSGSVHAEEVTGPLEVRTGRGPVTVLDCRGPVDITSSGGVVVLRRVSDRAVVRNRSGDVHVWWLAASAQVATTTGNVRLGWSRAEPVHLVLASNVGRVQAEVPSSAGAAHEVRVTSVSGDITVEASSPGR